MDRKTEFSPRYVGIDLIKDESINKISEIANSVGISFQFLKLHSADVPLFESDCMLWDTFHCAGNLLYDLKRNSPYIRKYIIIVGTKIDGNTSEAFRRALDFEIVATELRISSSEVVKGLNSALKDFLDTDNKWVKVKEQGDITILERIAGSSKWLFKD